ncbi:hypothetical protein [Deinococcus koreensis]|nr:hypothetical protein [Deinococcus koreensis]
MSLVESLAGPSNPIRFVVQRDHPGQGANDHALATKKATRRPP